MRKNFVSVIVILLLILSGCSFLFKEKYSPLTAENISQYGENVSGEGVILQVVEEPYFYNELTYLEKGDLLIDLNFGETTILNELQAYKDERTGRPSIAKQLNVKQEELPTVVVLRTHKKISGKKAGKSIRFNGYFSNYNAPSNKFPYTQLIVENEDFSID